MVAVKNNEKYRSNPRITETFYKIEKKTTNYYILDVMIKKGQRHQIRVHLSSIGTPIVGDKLYSKTVPDDVKNHLLYCYKVKFKTPAGENKEVKTDVDFIARL